MKFAKHNCELALCKTAATRVRARRQVMGRVRTGRFRRETQNSGHWTGVKSRCRELAVGGSSRTLPKVAGPPRWRHIPYGSGVNLYRQCRSRAAVSSLAFSAVPEPIMSARESANGLLEA